MMHIDPKSLGRIAVLMGGLSTEREVSLISGKAVLETLQAAGADATAFDPGTQSLADLAAGHYDRAFNILHGVFGEDGAIQGALELMGIPYTGSGIRASAISMDKIATTRLWSQAGLPVPRAASAKAALTQDAARSLIARLGARLVVKPSHGGSSIGLTRLMQADPDSLNRAIALALERDTDAAIEEFVEGRELTVAVLGTGESARALPIIEIRAPGGDYDYEHKYFIHDVEYLCPAPLDDALAERIRRTVVEAYRDLGCRTWGRIDLILRSDGSFCLLEANTAPGMTSTSLVPLAARTAGLSYEDLVLSVAADAHLEIAR